MAPNALDFDPVKTRELLSSALTEEDPDGLVPVFSSERLVGSSHSGGHDGKELADRLRTLFPDGRVALVIRSQPDMIASTYNQYVRRGGPCTLREYIFPPGDMRVPLFDLEHFAYHRLIQYHQALFGEENVLTLSVEELRMSPQNFLVRLQRFAGARTDLSGGSPEKVVNAASSPFTLALKRRLHFLAGRSTLNPHVNALRAGLLGRMRQTPPAERLLGRKRSAPPRSGVKLDDTGEPPVIEQFLDAIVPSSVQRTIDERLRHRINDLIGDYYRESNHMTQQITGLDLQSWGYAV